MSSSRENSVCIHDSHCVDGRFAKARLEHAVGEQGEPILHRRVTELPEVAGKERVLDAGGPDALEHLCPRDTTGMRDGEAPFQECAATGECHLIEGGKVLGGEVRMCNHDPLDACVEGCVDDREDLVTGEVAGREDELVARNRGYDAGCLRQQ